jgi:hypothetical protein
MMKQFITMGKGKKLKEFRGKKMDDDFNTDRHIFEGNSTSFMYTEDREFAKVFDATFEFSEDEDFNGLINDSSFDYKEGAAIDKEFGDVSREVLTNEFEDNQHMFHQERLQQEEEFMKIFYTTGFKFKEDDEFDRLFDSIPNEPDVDERFTKTVAKGTTANKVKQDLDIKGMKCPVLRGGIKQEEFDEFAKEWSQYAEYKREMDSRELKQQLMNCVIGPMEMIMYNSLGSKLDSLSEPDLFKELEKLAVMKHIAEPQDMEVVDCVNKQAVVYMENTNKPTSPGSPPHFSLTQKDPIHSDNVQTFHPENTNDNLLVVQDQEVQQVVAAEDQDLAAEEQALATEIQQVVAAEDQDLAAEDQALETIQPVVAEDDQTVREKSTAGININKMEGNNSKVCRKEQTIIDSEDMRGIGSSKSCLQQAAAVPQGTGG